MNTHRLHIDGTSVVWVMARCCICSEIHKYPAAEAIRSPIVCLSCGSGIQFEVGAIEAYARVLREVCSARVT
jgi:hypothetical protein